MRLRREGDKLEGQVIESPFNTWEERVEVRGSIKPNGEFQIDSRNGLRWYGKISAAGSISGVRPNGDPEDPTVPKFPFTLNLEKTLPNDSVL